MVCAIGCFEQCIGVLVDMQISKLNSEGRVGLLLAT